MPMRQLVLPVAATLAIASAAGCGSEGSSRDWEERSMEAVGECRGHGGVSAVDDDVVICVDQTSSSDRGRHAVDACRGHGGGRGVPEHLCLFHGPKSHPAAG